jgi:uncharacterized lipoprotein NlpE involved in copper resistance
MITIPADFKDALKFNIDSPHGYTLTVYSKEQFMLEDEMIYLKQKSGLNLIDVEGAYSAQNANTFFVLFR